MDTETKMLIENAANGYTAEEIAYILDKDKIKTLTVVQVEERLKHLQKEIDVQTSIFKKQKETTLEDVVIEARSVLRKLQHIMDTSDFESNPRGLISVIQQLNSAVGNLAKLMKHDAPKEQTINVLSLNNSIQDMLPTILSNLALEGAIDVKSSALQKQIKGLDKGLSTGDTAKTIIDI